MSNTSTNTITKVERDGDVVIVTLDNGAQFHPGGYPAIAGTPDNPIFGVALRDPASPTGALLDQAPTLTYDVALQFRGAGIEDKEVLATIAKGPLPATPAGGVPFPDETNDGAAEDVDATNEEQSDPETPVVVANHIHVSLLRQIIDQIEAGERVLVHEIANALHAL